MFSNLHCLEWRQYSSLSPRQKCFKLTRALIQTTKNKDLKTQFFSDVYLYGMKAKTSALHDSGNHISFETYSNKKKHYLCINHKTCFIPIIHHSEKVAAEWVALGVGSFKTSLVFLQAIWTLYTSVHVTIKQMDSAKEKLKYKTKKNWAKGGGRAQHWRIQWVWAVVMRSNRKWNWAQLSIAVLSFSLERVMRAFVTSDSKVSQNLTSLANVASLDVNKLWARVSVGGVGEQVWRSSISGQTLIPLCFLVVVRLSLCARWKPPQRHLWIFGEVSESCQILMNAYTVLHLAR